MANSLTDEWFSDLYFKVLIEGVKLKFQIFIFHKGIRNKKFYKFKNFHLWVPKDILSKGQKPRELGRGGVQG